MALMIGAQQRAGPSAADRRIMVVRGTGGTAVEDGKARKLLTEDFSGLLILANEIRTNCRQSGVGLGHGARAFSAFSVRLTVTAVIVKHTCQA